MGAERDPGALLSRMKPELRPTIPTSEIVPTAISALLVFREQEGTTLVILREAAEAAGLRYAFPSRLITLTVHSALDAVGFLAAITARLAQAGISVNAVSAFHHDQLFVPTDRADEAMAILQETSKAKRS